ncbi:hypothetical protein GQX74_011436 [Glossina fuscipes]|nr:hypothetical protein GQX74_011436 [Glossina fuscipes]
MFEGRSPHRQIPKESGAAFALLSKQHNLSDISTLRMLLRTVDVCDCNEWILALSCRNLIKLINSFTKSLSIFHNTSENLLQSTTNGWELIVAAAAAAVATIACELHFDKLNNTIPFPHALPHLLYM